jgi:chloride channel protein, CIC family
MSSSSGESERLRIPQPLIKHRVPSGRGAMEQPNVTHDGEARLSGMFWLAVIATGVATGLIGDGLMIILAWAERLAFNFHGGSFQNAVAQTSGLHRVTSLVIAGIFGAGSWFLIRKYLGHEKSEIDDSLWRGDGELSVRRSALTSIVSEIVIGLGASIGREAAPKLMGGASGSLISHYFKLSSAQKRLLVACGGGAGFACVYNIPLGGAIFAAEVLYGSFALPAVLPALATALIATATGWLYLPNRPTYLDIPNFRLSATLMVWSIVAGFVIGIITVGYIRVIGWLAVLRPSGTRLLWIMPLTFALVGVIGIKYPQIFGNGKDIAHQAFLGVTALSLLAALAIIKPFVTALTLGSGAAGGLLTPVLATGALLGGLSGSLWLHMWPGASLGAFALIGAAAMLGAAMQAPLAGLVIILELIHGGFNIAIPMMAATLIATVVVRAIDGYSIYSARLPKLKQ